MRCLIILALMFGLQGCITLNELAVGAGATAGAAVGAATGLGTAATVTLTAAGAGAAAVVTDPPETLQAETVEAIQNPWQAMAVAFNDLLNHAFEIVIAIGIAVIAIPMIVSFAIGKVMPNRKSKEIEQENKVLKKMMDK